MYIRLHRPPESEVTDWPAAFHHRSDACHAPGTAHLHTPRGVDQHNVAAVTLRCAHCLSCHLGRVLLIAALIQGHLWGLAGVRAWGLAGAATTVHGRWKRGRGREMERSMPNKESQESHVDRSNMLSLTPRRAACVFSCSTAPARNVSHAANSTEHPCCPSQ
jgi:hypothetical protein